MAGNGRNKTPWIRFSGIGIEFAAAVGGLGFFGYWIDLKYGSEPWGVIIGAALGLIGGTYNLIRQSMSAFDSSDSSKKSDDDADSSKR